jgi:hypothetical protein
MSTKILNSKNALFGLMSLEKKGEGLALPFVT